MKDIFTDAFIKSFHPYKYYVIVLSKTKDSKVKPVRQVQKKAPKRQRNKGKISHYTPQEEGRKKEKDKATIHKKTHNKSGPVIFGLHTLKRQAVRTMRKYTQFNEWPLDKKRKKASKMG